MIKDLFIACFISLYEAWVKKFGSPERKIALARQKAEDDMFHIFINKLIGEVDKSNYNFLQQVISDDPEPLLYDEVLTTRFQKHLKDLFPNKRDNK